MSKQIIFKCIHFKYERRPAILFTFSVHEMSFSADRSRANLSVISCVMTVNIHTRSFKIARQPWKSGQTLLAAIDLHFKESCRTYLETLFCLNSQRRPFRPMMLRWMRG